MMFIYSLTWLFVALSVGECTCCNNAFPHCPQPNKGLALITFNTTLNQRAFMIPGENFYENILGYNESLMKEFKTEALQYLTDTFGLVNPEKNSSFITWLYQTNPAADMRCVVLSGETYLPQNGFTVLDGGWMVIVNASQGITLGGAYSGMHVNYGTTFSVSHWLIQRVDSVGTPRPSLLWKVRSTAPGITAFSGVTTISHGELSVSSNEWGTGTSLHMTKYSYRGNDEAHALLRNTITF